MAIKFKQLEHIHIFNCQETYSTQEYEMKMVFITKNVKNKTFLTAQICEENDILLQLNYFITLNKITCKFNEPK